MHGDDLQQAISHLIPGISARVEDVATACQHRGGNRTRWNRIYTKSFILAAQNNKMTAEVGDCCLLSYRIENTSALAMRQGNEICHMPACTPVCGLDQPRSACAEKLQTCCCCSMGEINQYSTSQVCTSTHHATAVSLTRLLHKRSEVKTYTQSQ